MDDFTVYGNNFEESLQNLEKVLIRCQETNLALSYEKCKMLLTEGIVLGHHISSKGIQVDPTKIEIITSLPPPKTQREVKNLLGHASYYHRFIVNFTKLATPLFKFLVKDVDFCWDQYCQLAFETLKAELSLAPVLRGPNWSLHFHIYTDVSENSLGGVLEQKDNQDYYAIYFINKNLTPT